MTGGKAKLGKTGRAGSSVNGYGNVDAPRGVKPKKRIKIILFCLIDNHSNNRT
jgi:hypothetical protein